MEKRKAKCSGYGMFTGFFGVVALGIVFGVLIGIPLDADQGWDLSALAALLATGIGLAYIVLSLVDWAVQRHALASNPLPDDLDLSDRAIAAERLAALNGCTPLHRHIRRLLAAWASGASGPQVAAMAGNQSHRMLGMLAAETAAVWALLACTANFIPPQVLLTLGTGLMALLVVVAIARFQLASHFAGYIESHLLARIGNDTPAAAGLDFAQAVAKSVSDSTAALAAAQATFADHLAKTQQEAAALTAKAQADAAAQLAKAQADAAALIAKTQQETSAQVVKAQGDTSAKLASSQQEIAAQLAQAQDKVAEQLGRVTEIAASIDQIFKLQQAVDNTLKGVAVTDEFKSTLVELKRHLAESDQLLKNAAKPRTIRLVEKDNE
ncbi:MAG: hypothetical protein AB7V14_01705 [Kiritimatiellia bacterium]